MTSDEPPEGYEGFPTFDWYLGQAVQAVIEDGKEDLASRLLACRLSFVIRNDDGRVFFIIGTIHGPMTSIREFTRPSDQPRYDEQAFYPEGFDYLKEVFELVLAPRIQVRGWTFNVEGAPLPSNWRAELLETLPKKVQPTKALKAGSHLLNIRICRASIPFRHRDSHSQSVRSKRHTLFRKLYCTTKFPGR